MKEFMNKLKEKIIENCLPTLADLGFLFLGAMAAVIILAVASLEGDFDYKIIEYAISFKNEFSDNSLSKLFYLTSIALFAIFAAVCTPLRNKEVKNTESADKKVSKLATFIILVSGFSVVMFISEFGFIGLVSLSSLPFAFYLNKAKLRINHDGLKLNYGFHISLGFFILSLLPTYYFW